jgi:hypothetical protein
MNAHQQLFNRYVEELATARSAANAWWSGTLRRETRAGASDDEALERVRARWPAGPTSHPRVIAVVRKYFLLCEELNRTLPEPGSGDGARLDADEPDWRADEPGDEAPDATPQEEDWGPDERMEPPVLLFEMLSGRRESLAEFMIFYIYACIGERDGVAV